MQSERRAVTDLPAWRALQAHAERLRPMHLRALFASDPRRGERLSIEDAGILLDYSKNRVTAETIELLLALADACGVRARIEAMFRGGTVNTTEKRPALHIALRAQRDASITVNGRNVVPQVHEMLDRMRAFVDQVRGGGWKGHSGRRIRRSAPSPTFCLRK